MVAPVAAGIKETAGDKVQVAYVMTDGGALPLSFSRLISDLRDKALIDTVITCGHAFGGETSEAINIYLSFCVRQKNAQMQTR